MSIKRTKQYSRVSRGRDGDGSSLLLTPKPLEPEWSWEEHVAKQPDTSFVPYTISQTFEKTSLIVHPVFGKGVVTGVEGQRIEVLFQDGKKKLGHAR